MEEREAGRTTPEPGTAARSACDERLASIIRALPEVTFVLDEDGRYREILAGDEELLYKKRPELKDRTLHEILPRDVADGALGRIREALRSGEIQVFEYRLGVLAGTRWFEGRCGPLPPGEDGLGRVIWVARDITERKATEEALRRSEARLHTVIESLPFDIWLLESDGRYGLVNSAARERWGADVEGRTPAEVAPDADTLARWERNNARVRAGEVLTQETSFREGARRRHVLSILCPVEERDAPPSDGTERVDWSGPEAEAPAPARPVLGIEIDITEQRELAEQLQRAQRLESIGLLAGGIAHDFNNILTSIIGSITLARLGAESGAEVDELLTGAEKACLRARGLTQQLLTFSRGGAPIKETGSIAHLVEETAAFVLRGSRVRADIDLPDDLWPAEFDESQMSQVFGNLLVNAIQAMPEGGAVRIGARNRELPPDGGADGGAVRRVIEVDVSDEGIGIAPEHLDRVFDPYFTTKSEGSGLGLATSYSIVRRHAGDMAVTSEPGRGTTVRVTLPAADDGPVAADEAEEERSSPSPRGGRVLVMDDEPLVRDAVASMLRHLGFATETVPGGEEAIARYVAARDDDAPFDVVIMDLTIPGGMSGKEAARSLREIDPGARLVASSGYSTDPVMADPAAYGFDAVVPKPFLLADLAAVLGRLLGR